MYIIYIFRTIVLIFIAMFIATFWPLYTLAFFRWLELTNLGKDSSVVFSCFYFNMNFHVVFLLKYLSVTIA